MKKPLLLFTITINFLLITINLFSQPCLPEGITFNTQAQIDNFTTNYPNCNEIEGNVTIEGSDITNLYGLSVLTSVEGNLIIINNNSLTNLEGLEGLGSIEGNLDIYDNIALITLTGLNNLTYIGGNLRVADHGPYGPSILTSLTGLEEVISVGGDIKIFNNPFLTSLTGLAGLTSIGGHLDIGSNDTLTNLEGLEGVTSIGGLIRISDNDGLTNLTGLENVTSLDEDLLITSNDALTNLVGLDNLGAIEGSCEISRNDALTNLIGLEQLTSIGEDLLIGNDYIYSLGGNNSLKSLTGLEGLTSIGGKLLIYDNDSLTSLAGLEGLTFIEGSFQIYHNDALMSLTGMEELTSIGLHLFIGFIHHGGGGNPSLMNLTGLEGLTTIGGMLLIYDNEALTSLSGLDNIESGTIENIKILINPSLSTCEIESICAYLASPNGVIEIHDNAIGCNSPEEVQEACDSIQTIEPKFNQEATFILSPNPCLGTVYIQFKFSEPQTVNCIFIDISGIRIKDLISEVKNAGIHDLKIDLRDLNPGVYFCTLKTNEGIQTRKIIKL